MPSTLVYILSSLAGTIGLWKILEFIRPEIKDYIVSRTRAKEVFNRNLDPIIKASNELLGKITSLSRTDFEIFRTDKPNEGDLLYIIYLFANFWSRLSILKIESDYTALSKIKKGEELLVFISTLEASRNRIIDRYKQRIIGEAIIDQSSKPLRPITMFDFFEMYNSSDSVIKKYFTGLEHKLVESKDKKIRQEVLLYGIIIHALIEHFDPKNKLIRKRNPYTNKLSEKTKEELEKRVFGNFLPFVKKPWRFYKK